MQSLQATTETADPTLPTGPGTRARLLQPGQWSLATRLTLVVVALMVPLELIVLWTAFAGIQERRDAELEDAILIGQSLAAVVDGFASNLQSTTLATAFALGSQPGQLDQAWPATISDSSQRSTPRCATCS